MTWTSEPLRAGIGGPGGAGKTELGEALCRRFGDEPGIVTIAGNGYARKHVAILT
jgi:Ni2+-binding GTPase involved in maturation of urease and hydrogenase